MRRSLLSVVVVGLLVLSAGAADEAKGPAMKLGPRVMELLKGTPEEFIKRFDKNNDGVLTKDEVPPQMAEHFERIDQNGDGKLDRAEIAALLDRLRARMKGAEEAKPKPVVAGEKPATASPEKTATTPAPSRTAAVADFERLDRNADGRLTREELKGTAYEAHFDEIDANKDGKIDPKEFQAYVRKMADGR